MRRICVFCGSQQGHDARFHQAAVELGNLLVDRGLSLVYGGGQVGLMGAVADAVLQRGGEVIGVIPDFLSRAEIRHDGLTRLEIVHDMHSRKARMASLSDGFIALPGGFGTLEEFFEVVTWAQLDLHSKPIGLLNVGGFYDPLLQLVETACTNGLLREPHARLILHHRDATGILDEIESRLAGSHSDAPDARQT